MASFTLRLGMSLRCEKSIEEASRNFEWKNDQGSLNWEQEDDHVTVL